MLYDVQIQKTKGGEWQWAGVEPGKGQPYGTTWRQSKKMAQDPYWTEVIGAVAFRVKALPGQVKGPSPKQIANAAIADMHSALAALEKAIRERDEARAMLGKALAGKGLEVEW